MSLVPVPPSALAVFAHPDDPDIACGATLALWAGQGCEVHVAICARGEKGTTDPSVHPDRLAARRLEEIAAAGEALGVTEQHMLGHPDGEIDEERLWRELVGLVRALRPHTVICPDPEAVFFGSEYFNHRDHRRVGWAALDAVAPAAALPHYFPGLGAPHQVEEVLMSGTLAEDCWVEVGDALEAKTAAVRCHASQSWGDDQAVSDLVRRRAAEAGRRAGVPFAEAFRRLRLSSKGQA